MLENTIQSIVFSFIEEFDKKNYNSKNLSDFLWLETSFQAIPKATKGNLSFEKFENKFLAELEKFIVNEEELKTMLPSGSGINGSWNIKTLKNGNILCKNNYSTMDEYGYYREVVPFSVKIFRHKEDLLHPLNNGQKQIIHQKNDIDFSIYLKETKHSYGLKEDFEESFSYALESILSKTGIEIV